MALEQFANDPGTTLSSGCNASQTTISVTSSSGYPSVGNFRIKIESEIMIVTAVSGTTWTVTRAAEGTTGTSHNSGTIVNHALTAAGLAQGFVDYSPTVTTWASRPTATIGRSKITMFTDSPYTQLDNGSTLSYNLGHFHNVSPPGLVSGLGYYNSTSAASLSTSTGSIAIKTASNAPLYYGKSMPSPSAFDIKAMLHFAIPTLNYCSFGLFIGDGSGKVMIIHCTYAGGYIAEALYYNASWGSFGGAFGSSATERGFHGQPIWFRITNTINSERQYLWSHDGKNWVIFYNEPTNQNFTPSVYGIFTNSTATGDPGCGEYYHLLMT